MTKDQMDNMQLDVAKSAIMLDEKLPGWYRRVKLTTLEMTSCITCVLGQLSPDTIPNPYTYMLRQLELDESGGRDYAFDLPTELQLNTRSWHQLGAYWKAEIRQRRRFDNEQA
jgi:hypothetical protein